MGLGVCGVDADQLASSRVVLIEQMECLGCEVERMSSALVAGTGWAPGGARERIRLGA